MVGKRAAGRANMAKNKTGINRSPVHLTVNRPELLSDGSDIVFRQFVHDALAFAARLLAVRDGYGKVMGISGPGRAPLGGPV